MNTPLEAVRAKVIEAVPEIGKLVDAKPWRICEDCLGGGLVSDENGENTDACLNCAGTGKVPNEPGKRVLSQKRPITLADVLRAIPKRMYLKTIGDYTRLVDDGDGYVHHGPVFWDLTRPSLDEQEQEVIEFLHKILCV